MQEDFGRFFGSGTTSGREATGHRGSRDPHSVVMLKVPADGFGAGVQAGRGELLAELDDQVDDLGRD